MNLDFSKCKTAEDVNKVFVNHEDKIKNLERFKRKIEVEVLNEYKENV